MPVPTTPPVDPIELQIVEAIRTRLREVRVENGYHYDAGENVHLGRVIDPELDALPALVVWLAEPVTAGENVPGVIRRRLPVVVEGVVGMVDDEDPLEATLKVARDIKSAVYRLDNLVLVAGAEELELVQDEHFPPDAGSNVATAQVTLSVPYVEKFTG